MSSNTNTAFPTKNQVPDHAILDYFNKQTYLGNQFMTCQAFTVSTSELPILLLANPSKTLSLFQNLIGALSLTAAHTLAFKVYFNPTITAGAQTVGLVADVSGSLNSTYFLLNDAQGNKFYVWFNINSAGVDPAIAGRTAIPVTGATNVTAATLGAAMAIAIAAANGAASFTTSGTSTVTITNKVKGSFTPAVDGAAATGFTFAVTSASNGTVVTPSNMRPASNTTAQGVITISPTITSNGSLINTISSQALINGQSNVLSILDPGQTLLVTSIASASSSSIVGQMGWMEL